ncbi:MAG: glycosyltransferase [Phormidesmis sp.]
MTTPILSICIPAYNRPVWLKRALLSILNTSSDQQPQIEVIVSDDSTIPDCQQLVNNLLATWQGPWQYQNNSPSLGMAANWNRCIQMATGSYVLLLHDDDYLEPRALSNILKTVEANPNTSALLFGVNVVTAEQKTCKQQTVKRQKHLNAEAALERVLSNSSFIRFPGIVIKKEIFEEIGYFDEKIGGVADIHMWVRICRGHGLLCIPTITANYTVHANALTMKMFTFQTVKKLEGIFDEVEFQPWLPAQTLRSCKSDYFHQFILAGTLRYAKACDFNRAKEVFTLFNRIDIHPNQASIKWKAIKTVFKVLLACIELFISVPQSNEA